MHINDFIKLPEGYVKAFRYNLLDLDAEKHNIYVSKERNVYTLYINNQKVIMEDSRITENIGLSKDGKTYTIKISLPNKSVLTDADDMMNALNAHHRSPEFHSGWDKGMTIDQKIEYIFHYIEKYMKFNHRRFAETLTTALVRDIDDPSRKARKDSKDIKFIKVIEVVSKPSYSNNLASTIPYGYYNNQISFIKNPSGLGVTQSSDYDILYMSKDRKQEMSPYAKLSSKVAELLPSEDEVSLQ